LQGPAAPETPAVDAAAAGAAAAAEEGGKKKDKKKDKKGAGGLLLGKGSGIVRTHLEKALAAAAAAGATLEVVDGQLAAAGVLLEGTAGVDAVEGVITSHEAAAVKMLEDVKVVVEANQARRKPKVCVVML
jgi:hypothetical protein